jgi:hypothetical protein
LLSIVSPFSCRPGAPFSVNIGQLSSIDWVAWKDKVST